jgi:hypothetical protein
MDIRVVQMLRKLCKDEQELQYTIDYFHKYNTLPPVDLKQHGVANTKSKLYTIVPKNN